MSEQHTFTACSNAGLTALINESWAKTSNTEGLSSAGAAVVKCAPRSAITLGPVDVSKHWELASSDNNNASGYLIISPRSLLIVFFHRFIKQDNLGRKLHCTKIMYDAKVTTRSNNFSFSCHWRYSSVVFQSNNICSYCHLLCWGSLYNIPLFPMNGY